MRDLDATYGRELAGRHVPNFRFHAVSSSALLQGNVITLTRTRYTFGQMRLGHDPPSCGRVWTRYNHRRQNSPQRTLLTRNDRGVTLYVQPMRVSP